MSSTVRRSKGTITRQPIPSKKDPNTSEQLQRYFEKYGADPEEAKELVWIYHRSYINTLPEIAGIKLNIPELRNKELCFVDGILHEISYEEDVKDDFCHLYETSHGIYKFDATCSAYGGHSMAEWLRTNLITTTQH